MDLLLKNVKNKWLRYRSVILIFVFVATPGGGYLAPLVTRMAGSHLIKARMCLLCPAGLSYLDKLMTRNARFYHKFLC